MRTEEAQASGRAGEEAEDAAAAPKASKAELARKAGGKVPLYVLVAFFMANVGAGILPNLLGALLVYFYLPPSNAGLPQLITDRTFLGILNAISLLAAGGRITDSITDLLIASWSDRFTGKTGRRVPFMKWSLLPAAAFTALCFWTPVQSVSGWNVAWLALVQVLMFSFLTAYTVPMYSLVTDITESTEDRLRVTIWTSIAYGIGTVIAAMVFFLAPMLERVLVSAEAAAAGDTSMGTLRAWQLSATAISLVAAVFMAFPVFMLNEQKLSRHRPSTVHLWPALKLCLGHKFYRPIVVADFFIVGAAVYLQSGLVYYVTVLLQLPEFMATLAVLVLIALSIVQLPVLPFVTRRVGGAKGPLLVAFALTSLTFVSIALFGVAPGALYLQCFGAIALFSVAYAVLESLVFWLTSDCAEHASLTTGESTTAMFYATRYFVNKLGVTAGVVSLALLLQLGRDPGDAAGVRAAAIVGAAVCVLVFVIYYFGFDEKALRQELKELTAQRDAHDCNSASIA